MTLMKSDCFSLSRFALLAAKDWHENHRKYLLSVASLWIALIICALFVGKNDLGKDAVLNFSLIMILFGFIWASLSFSDMKDRMNIITTLMLPVTATERFAFRWIVAIPMFLIIFIPSAQLAEYLRAACSPEEVAPVTLLQLFQEEPTRETTIAYFFIFMALQSVYFLGAIVWPKMSAIKTTVAIAAVIAVCSLIHAAIIKLFLPEDHYIYPLVYLISNDMDNVIIIILGLVAVTFTAAVYAASFLRLKETDVVHRR